jgi:hypothetical protein
MRREMDEKEGGQRGMRKKDETERKKEREEN